MSLSQRSRKRPVRFLPMVRPFPCSSSIVSSMVSPVLAMASRTRLNTVEPYLRYQFFFAAVSFHRIQTPAPAFRGHSE